MKKSRDTILSWLSEPFHGAGLSVRKKAGCYVAVYTFLFLLISIGCFSPFWRAAKGLLPVAGQDGLTQHYPFLIYIGQYLRQILSSILAGNPLDIPLFDFRIGFGEDILTTFSYYGLGDPLEWVSTFVPARFSELLYNIFVSLRIYLAGLSFSILSTYFHKTVNGTLCGALVYVFSNFTFFYSIRQPFFMIPMVLFPLLIVGTDLILQERSPYLFIAITFLFCLSNFYFFYMATIFMGIYFLARIFTLPQQKSRKNMLRLICKGILYYLIAVCLASVLFIPVALAFLQSGRDASAYTYPGNPLWIGSTRALRCLLYLFSSRGQASGIAALLPATLPALAILYADRQSSRLLKILFPCAMLFYLIPILEIGMNGFARTGDRWSFIVPLLGGMVLAEALPELIENHFKYYRICTVVLLADILYCLTCIFFKIHIKGTEIYILTSCLSSAIFLLLLTVIRKPAFKRLAVLSLLCAFSVLSGYFMYAPAYGNYVEGYLPYQEASQVKNTAGPAIHALRDSSFFRVDCQSEETDLRKMNKKMISNVDYNGLSAYWSILNHSVIDSLLRWEIGPGIRADHFYISLDQQTILDGLLGVKYYVQHLEDGKVTDRNFSPPFGYSQISSRSNKSSQDVLYQNDYALPLGYTYTHWLSEERSSHLSAAQRKEAMLQAVILEEAPDGISELEAPRLESRPIPCQITEQKDLEWENGRMSVQKAGACLSLQFDGLPNSETYVRIVGMKLEGSGVERVDVRACGDYANKTTAVTTNKNGMYILRDTFMINLGYSEQPQSSVQLFFPVKGSFPLENIEIICQPMENYPQQIDELREEALENVKMASNKITGRLNLTQNKILCLSIPYSDGWSAFVDGKPVSLMRANDMLMAIPVAAGEHEIELRYLTPGLKPGLFLTGMGCLALALLIIVRKRKNSCHQDTGKQVKR